jgi:hypothetical protein
MEIGLLPARRAQRAVRCKTPYDVAAGAEVERSETKA